MTAPLCHGTAGGCLTLSRHTIHSCDCPMRHAPRTKRTMGQCLCHPDEMGIRAHVPDCPALYPLQRQPGDEKDALTRLTAWCRTARDTENPDGWEYGALDLISEARAEQRANLASVTQMPSVPVTNGGARIAELEHELARAKALVATLAAERDAALAGMTKASSVAKTLTLQQSEVRQRFLAEGRAQGHTDASNWLRSADVLRTTANDMAEALAALMDSTS